MRPAVSVRETVLPRKDQSSVYSGVPGTRRKAPVTAPSPGKKWKKTSFFSGFPGKKSGLIIGVCVVAVIIVASIFFILTPSGSPAFNPTSPGMNDTLPDFSAVAVPTSPDGNTGTSAENPGPLENPEETYVPLETPPENPEEIYVPLETPPTPALTFARGDPGAVLAMYPSLFNSGDGAGLWDLLSEHIKSQYSVDTLNTELAAARSNGYSIQDIQVYTPAIDEGIANVETDFFWNIGGTPVTRSPRIFFVYEGERWRLDNLILTPENL